MEGLHRKSVPEMKKLIITIVVLVLVVGGYYYVRQHAQVSIGLLEGKVMESYRGDLVVPITASGKIEPASIIEIKGKASGEVQKTPFKDGMMVRKGDIIIRLDPQDEQRNVVRSKSDAARANITVTQASISLRERTLVGLPLAEAKSMQAKAREELAKREFENEQKLKQMRDADPKFDAASLRDYLDAKARWEIEQAGVKASQAELDQAKLAIETANLEVDAAKETLATAQKTLEDAEERLRETTVLSPIDGMVLSRRVQIGEVVQSGKTSLTGGTILMEIADVSDVYAVVNVDEADIGQVRELAPPSARPGPTASQPVTFPEGAVDMHQKVEVTVETFRDEKFYGLIERISPQSQLVQAIATFKVWIRMVSENRDKLIGLLNTQAEAHFKVNSVRNAVLVNYDAIMKDPNGDSFGVFVRVVDPVTGKPKAEFRKCKFGLDNGIDAEVIEGLDVGVKVYTQLPQKTRKEQEAEGKGGGD